MPYSLDGHGRPLFLISSMAMHTQNVEAERRANLLFTRPGWSGDPLAGGRATLMGYVTLFPEADLVAAPTGYLERYDYARSWVDFDDFNFYPVDVTDVYYVGGYGAVSWVRALDFTEADVDPLAHVAPGIIDHMNQSC